MKIDIKKPSIVYPVAWLFGRTFRPIPLTTFSQLLSQSRPFRNRSPASFPPVPMSINSTIELPRRWNQENRRTERREGDRERTDKKGGTPIFNENILAELSAATTSIVGIALRN